MTITTVKFPQEDTHSSGLRFHHDTHDELCMSSDRELEAMKDSLRDAALQFLVADIHKSGPHTSFRPISPLPKLSKNPLSFSAPIPRPQFTLPIARECSTPVNIPSSRPVTPSFSPSSLYSPSSSSSSTPYYTPSKSLPTTPIPSSNNSNNNASSSLIQKFYDLIKYINVPDLLHGLENFGYLSSDQSVELFEIVMQVRNEFPELARVLPYDAGDRPVCTVQHKGVTCDSCLATDISGTRYKCAVCPNFDMCEKCERKGMLTHDITHPRIKMIVPNDCNFEHTCSTHTLNSQGEKTEVTCPFAISSPIDIINVSNNTYQKRQLQFTTLMKRKQIRETMRKVYLQEEERQRQEEQRKREQEEAERREKEEIERKKMQEERERQLQREPSILRNYFDNLKKQNKLQPIIDESSSSSIPSSSSSSPSLSSISSISSIASSSSPSSPSSRICQSGEAISVSGNLAASNSSVNCLNQATSSLNQSCNLANSYSSAIISSPLALSSSSLSPPTSPPAPHPAVLLTVPSTISSRIQQPKCLVVFESPDNSPAIPKPNFMSPTLVRESKLKYSTAIEPSDEEYETEEEEEEECDYESSSSSSTTQNEQSDLSEILREIGILHSSSESSSTSSSPKKGKDFFTSLRDLLR